MKPITIQYIQSGTCECGGDIVYEKGMLCMTNPPKELHVCVKCLKKEYKVL